MTSPTPAGWYPDPGNPSLVRWHNGTDWTDQTQPSANAPRLKVVSEDRKATLRVLFWIFMAIIGVSLLSYVDVTPAALGIFLVVVVLPIALVILVIRALIRVGNKPAAPVQVIAPAQGFAPGWYPDQQNLTQMRWFDGHTWTAATLPRL